MLKTISPSDLIPMDQYCDDYPITINLAYQHDCAPNIFGKIYRDGARLWLHKDLAQVVLGAAKIVSAQGYGLVLYDGLRTVEAQALMGQSNIVKANPHWLEEPGRLLSPPGAGAHPRGMAIDLSLADENGDSVDMGTDFDYLAENSQAAHNPAHREFEGLDKNTQNNRALLTDAMVKSSKSLSFPLLPLPQEWWDFRFPTQIYEQYAPLNDADLPHEMRMTA